MSYDGRPENLEFDFGSASLQLRADVGQLIQSSLDQIVVGIVDGMKKRYSLFKNDPHTLGRIFEQWHKRRYGFYGTCTREGFGKNGILEMCAKDDSSFLMLSSFRPVDFIHYAVEPGEIQRLVLEQFKGEPSETFNNAVAALEQWKRKHGDPFPFSRQHGKRGQYYVGYIRCLKADYEELLPHLGLLYLTHGLTSSVSTSKKESKGLAVKN